MSSQIAAIGYASFASGTPLRLSSTICSTVFGSGARALPKGYRLEDCFAAMVGVKLLLQRLLRKVGWCRRSQSDKH